MALPLVEIFSGLPPWLSTILIAMLPVSELRGAIPIAIGIYGMKPVDAFILSVIGNMIPVIPLLLFLEPVSNFLRKWNFWDKFFTWLFTRTHKNHSREFEKYGTLALAIFVAVPLPATGAWTGCASAFVFGIKFRNALIAITAGVVAAGVIVTLITVAGINLL